MRTYRSGHVVGRAICGLLLVVVHGAVSSRAEGATVRMRDGTTLEGTVRLDGGGLVVRASNGDEKRVELANVRHAVLKEETGPRTARKETGAKEKGAGKLKRVEGLLAEYFAGYDLKDLRLVRVDPKVDTWWSEHASPDPAVPENFSARWSGQVEAAHSETYSFRVGFDNGGRFWLDNRLVVDNWNGSGTFTTRMDLKAGQRYDVKLEFRKGRWGGNAKLVWQSKHQPEEAIPAKYLYPPAGTNPPTVSLRLPRADEVLVTPAAITVEADAADADGTVQKVEFFADGRSIGIVEQSPWRLEWKNGPAGHHKLTARATDNAGITAMSEPFQVVIGGNGDGTLPSPWMELSVGKFESLGSARYGGGAFTLKGHDGDLWGERDLLHCACQSLKGDGTIVARVRRFEAVHGSGAAAGLIIREHLSAERARQAFLGLVCDGGIAFVNRENAWEERKTAMEDPGEAPCWLKLSRYGKRIGAYRSADGKTWQFLGERQIEMPEAVFIGLVIANPVEEVGEAVFEEVRVIPGPPAMESTVKGVMLLSGSIIAGNIHSVDETSVKLGRPNEELVVPTSQVARLLIKPVTSEAIQRVQAGRTGVILNNGDFVDGSVTFKDGQVRVSSVLFGMRRFNTWDETIAAVLRPIQPGAHRYEVRAVDGSVLRAKSIAIEGGKLRVLEAADVALTLNGNDTVEIKTAE